MGRDDEDDRPERERPSWREVDRRRDSQRAREEHGPVGPAAQARVRQATRQYLKGLDDLFGGDPAGAEARKLADAMRRAHGTPGLAEACRAYRDAVGLPRDPGLLSLFLDANDPELVVWALEGMLAVHEAGALELRGGQRSQLRTLSLGADDAVAEAAEALLEQLG